MNMTTAQESAEQKSFTAANRASHKLGKSHFSQRMALSPYSKFNIEAASNYVSAVANEIDETQLTDIKIKVVDD